MNDIDCSSASLSLKLRGNTSGATILSDGVTLSNLNFTRGIVRESLELSIFGTINDQFSISNVTFENVSITASANRRITLFALSSSISANAKFENFAITGTLTATVGLPEGLELYNTEGGSRETWLFGRDANGLVNDSAYLAANQGKISVTDDRTLTITS